MDYNETIDYLLKNTGKKIKERESKIYRYKGDSGEEYFEKLFQFYSWNLAHNYKFGANPSYIIFYNKDELFSEALISKKHYIIAFNKGLIKKLLEWYHSYFDFGNIKGLEAFRKLEEEIRFKISELLEQAINHYVFYHEFAHLIQYVAEGDYIRENIKNCDYRLDIHIEEYDADIFSGICLAEHIFLFIKSSLNDDLDEDKLNNFIAIIISGVMVFILSLPNRCKAEFYTKETPYPHNLIRVNNIVMVIINQFKDIIAQEGSNIKVDEKFICGRSFMITKNLLDHFGLHDIALSFEEDMGKKWTFIEEYCNELFQKTSEYKFSAAKDWNSKLE